MNKLALLTEETTLEKENVKKHMHVKRNGKIDHLIFKQNLNH